jgi:hypothetical protein
MKEAGMSISTSIDLKSGAEPVKKASIPKRIGSLTANIEELTGQRFTFFVTCEAGTNLAVISSEDDRASLEIMDLCGELYMAVSEHDALPDACKHPKEASFMIEYNHLDMTGIVPADEDDGSSVSSIEFDMLGRLTLIPEDEPDDEFEPC